MDDTTCPCCDRTCDFDTMVEVTLQYDDGTHVEADVCEDCLDDAVEVHGTTVIYRTH